MKKTTPILAAALAALLTATSLQALAPKDSKAAVLFFVSQDCGASKALAPKFEALKNRFGQDPVLFVELDHTTAAGRNQSAMLAQALDMDEIYSQQNRESGVLIIVDSASEKEAARIAPEASEEEAAGAINQILSAPAAQ